MLDCKYGQLKLRKKLADSTRVLTVEGELVLGEEYPEIQEILTYRGYLSGVTGKKTEGRLSLDGQVEVHLVYRGKETEEGLTEYGVIWGGEKSILFEAELEFPEPAALWEWRAELKRFSLEPGPARTARYRGEISVQVQAGQERSISVVTEVAAEGVETVEERAVVEEAVAVLQGNREVFNQFSLVYPRPPLARIIDCRVRPAVVKVEVSPGRVTVEGQIETVLLYVARNEAGEEEGLETAVWNEKNGGTFPFQFILEEPRALPEQTARAEIRVESVSMSSQHPESCSLQAVLGARVELWEPRRLQVVLDVTTDKGKIIDLSRDSFTIEETVGETKKNLVLEKILTLPPGALSLERILLVDNSPPRLLDVRVEADRVFFEGEMGVVLLYAGKSGENQELVVEAAGWENSGSGAVTFAECLEMPGVEPGMIPAVTLEDGGMAVEIMDDRTVKLNFTLKAGAVVREERALSLVQDCALVPLPEQPRSGMLFYLVQPGDTLWGIARRYQTTTAALCKANDLSGPGEELRPGKKLLIPKTPLAG